MARTVIRGDSYGIRRPFYTYTFVDSGDLPLNLAGCTIRTTYKAGKASAADDPNDATAEIKHHITLNGSGGIVSQNGLYLESTAAAGILVERLTASETLALSLDTPLLNDVELTDSNAEVSTWLYEEPLTAIDAYTNRTTDV